jgi:hypothetical protein
MAGYFSNFPSIRYKSDNVDSVAKNIMMRGIMRDEVKNIVLETIEIKSGDRADQIAHLLYEKSDLDYMLYILNDIVDPYYEWYLTKEQFELLLNNKYGDEKDSVKHWIAITTNNSLASIQVRDSGSGFTNNDLVFVGINRNNSLGVASVITDDSGGIANFRITVPGSNITNPDNISFRRNGAPLNNDTAVIVPVLENFSGSDVIINNETYALLPESEQIKYEPVTNREYEDELNYQRRLFNAVKPEIAGIIQSQMKKLLVGQGNI